MIVVCTACLWRSEDFSKIQSDEAYRQHRAYDCPKLRLCAVCAEIQEGEVRPLEAGGPALFVCNRCWDEHPREGGYGYDDSPSASRATVGRIGPKAASRGSNTPRK